MGRTAGAALLAIYCTVGITSHFPCFHNHGPLNRRACCESKHTCALDSHPAGESIAAATHAGVHAHGDCMACMWQALAKNNRHAFDINTCIAYSASARHIMPHRRIYSRAFPNLPASRAPPAC